MKDLALLERWAAGDAAAARALFDRYYPAIYRFFANKTGSGIEDLIQETFMACVAGRERFRGDSTFRAYLYGTAKNVLKAALRKRKRDQVVDLEQESIHDLGLSASRIVTQRAEERLLLEGLRRLPVDYQIALELFYWEGLSGSEMTVVLEMSEAGVRSRLHRARVKLDRVLGTLEASDEVLQSTSTDLEGWAAKLRALLSPQDLDDEDPN